MPPTGVAVPQSVRDEIRQYMDKGMSARESHAAVNRNSANGNGLGALHSVSLSTVRRMYMKVKKYGTATPRKRKPTYSDPEAQAIRQWVKTQANVFSVEDLIKFFVTTFPGHAVPKRKMNRWLQSLDLSRGVGMQELLHQRKVRQAGNSGLVEHMPSAQEEEIRAQLEPLYHREVRQAAGNSGLVEDILSAQEEDIRAQLEKVFHRARQRRYNMEKKGAKLLRELASKVALGDSVHLTLPDHECHQLVQLVAKLHINEWPKQIVQTSPELTSPFIREPLAQLVGERHLEFADFRTAVSDQKKVSMETFNELAISLNFRSGWLKVPSGDIAQQPARTRPSRPGLRRPTCNETNPAARIMTGTMVARHVSVDPVNQLGVYINQISHGKDRPGGGAISDALPVHVFDALPRVYYPNVETPTNNSTSLKHLQKRQNGYDLVRLSRDLLVLAVPDVPGLAEILTAAESLELPSLSLSTGNPDPPPQRLRVVMADLLRQFDIPGCVTKYFWHQDKADNKGIFWYTLVLFLGKETPSGVLDTDSEAAIGVRVAGFDLGMYPRAGSFCVFPSDCFHKSESVTESKQVPLQKHLEEEEEEEEDDEAYYGEYKLVLFLGPVDTVSEVDWMSIQDIPRLG